MDTLYKISNGEQREEFYATGIMNNDIPIGNIRMGIVTRDKQNIRCICINIDEKFKGEISIVKDVVNNAWLVKKKDESNWKNGFKKLFS